jgi:hypothetical protein
VIAREAAEVVDQSAIGIRNEGMRDVVVVVRQPGFHGEILQATATGLRALRRFQSFP